MPEHNCGFGLGHNRGLLRSEQQVLLILNPDVELGLEALSEALRLLRSRPDVVALNPRCTGAGGEREYLCKRYPSVTDLFLRGVAGPGLRRRFASRLSRYEYRQDEQPGVQEQVHGYDQGPEPVELLSGACLLCRAEAFVAVGGFDARYFMYFEDFDLSLRLAALGKLVYLPSMHIRHYGGYAARKGPRHRNWFVRSGFRFFNRHGWKLL
jgi:GT2 family glycosyltransferase